MRRFELSCFTMFPILLLILLVSDQNLGLRPAVQTKIFRDFYKSIQDNAGMLF